ncbi:hypothetical protein LAZ67_X001681 [Cordylochernes scorpioides]|uniref:Uncharacterized protein n=1 Tax=Cordylochernes scorpioides TaxID=51811 RepID=A0ABY6LT42_9ARAC|nr:hypothetical protein LAZ67_X001681 [Cordylochernes scorpioides]
MKQTSNENQDWKSIKLLKLARKKQTNNENQDWKSIKLLKLAPRLKADGIQTTQSHPHEAINQRELRLGTNQERNVRPRRTLHTGMNLEAFHYDDYYDYSLHPSAFID